MNAVLCIVLLITVSMFIAYGAVRIGEVLIAYRDQSRSAAGRQEEFATQALAELRRNEIEASKRGDLLAAAYFAEQQEVTSA